MPTNPPVNVTVIVFAGLTTKSPTSVKPSNVRVPLGANSQNSEAAQIAWAGGIVTALTMA